LDVSSIEMTKTKEQKNGLDKISFIRNLIKTEIKFIEKNYDPSDWDYIEDRMESDEAFNRGCYRVYNQVLTWLNRK